MGFTIFVDSIFPGGTWRLSVYSTTGTRRFTRETSFMRDGTDRTASAGSVLLPAHREFVFDTDRPRRRPRRRARTQTREFGNRHRHFEDDDEFDDEDENGTAAREGHFSQAESWEKCRVLAALGLLALGPVWFCSCGPRREGPKAPLPQVGPLVPVGPRPSADLSGARPVDPAEALRPVEPREIVVPELKLSALLRRVSFDSRGQSLSAVIRAWSDGCGVNVALHPKLLGGTSPKSYHLWLRADKMHAVDALEWICRACRSWYVLLDQCVYLVPDYRWLANEDARYRADLIGGLYEGKGEDLTHFMHSCLEVYLKNNRSCRLSLQHASGRLTTVLPPEAYDVVKRIIREVETHAPFRVHRDQLPSSIMLPEDRAPRPRVITDKLLRERMQRTIQAIYRDTHVQDILADVAERTGLNLAFDVRAIPESRRSLTLNLGYVPAGSLLQEIVKRGYLKRLVVEPERGIWIVSEKRESEALRPRHQAWQRVVFRSYPARDLVETRQKKAEPEDQNEKQRPSPEKLLNYVIGKVGGNWREPAYAIAYNRPSGRLLLQHEVEVHARVPMLLSGYRRRLRVLGPRVPLLPPGAASGTEVEQ